MNETERMKIIERFRGFRNDISGDAERKAFKTGEETASVPAVDVFVNGVMDGGVLRRVEKTDDVGMF